MESFNNLSRSIKGRVALITGAASGMGKATAQVFAAEGARVIVTDINEDEAKNVCKLIESDGGEALAISLDITNEEQIKECIAESVKSFGQIDYLINNAGIASPVNIGDENQKSGINKNELEDLIKFCKKIDLKAVSYTHLTLPTNREV